ncbi:uncharacterized protein OCT59_017797 [Rhizophagus irregularis]|uniref:uncharacterized protein n=1 Tax=Rhizophagus irregularis TaxID=588596 RepID=UPI00332C6078|nr:hypothetical protein OCT59_017797 [Rhizophagus irregularis]
MANNKLLPKLLQNLLDILNDEEYYDITIEVGNDPYIKIFRCSNGNFTLSFPLLAKNFKKKNYGTLAYIKLPNISPN